MAKLSKRDRTGLLVLVGILLVLGVLLVLTTERPTGEVRGFDNNVLVERRMKSLENR